MLFLGGIIFSAFTARILSEKEFSLKVIKKCLYVSSGINQSGAKIKILII